MRPLPELTFLAVLSARVERVDLVAAGPVAGALEHQPLLVAGEVGLRVLSAEGQLLQRLEVTLAGQRDARVGLVRAARRRACRSRACRSRACRCGLVGRGFVGRGLVGSAAGLFLALTRGEGEDGQRGREAGEEGTHGGEDNRMVARFRRLVRAASPVVSARPGTPNGRNSRTDDRGRGRDHEQTQRAAGATRRASRQAVLPALPARRCRRGRPGRR